MAFALLAPGLVHALPACGPYEVAYYEYRPFYFRSESGDFSGIDKLLVEELAKRSGCILNGVLDSRVRTWSRLKDGTLAMTVSAIETPERKVFVDFIPYAKSRNLVFLKNSVAEKVSSPEAFSANPELRLGVVKAFKHGPAIDAWLDRLREQGRVLEYTDAEAVSRMAALGRIDAFLAEPGASGKILQDSMLGKSVSRFDWFPRDTFVVGLALSRSRVLPQDFQRLRLAFESMQRDGTVRKIYYLFMPPEVADSELL